jgi:hypothetical protein
MKNQEEIEENQGKLVAMDALLGKHAEDTEAGDEEYFAGSRLMAPTLQMGIADDSNNGGIQQFSGSGSGMVQPEGAAVLRAASDTNSMGVLKGSLQGGGQLDYLNRGPVEPAAELTEEDKKNFALTLLGHQKVTSGTSDPKAEEFGGQIDEELRYKFYYKC